MPKQVVSRVRDVRLKTKTLLGKHPSLEEISQKTGISRGTLSDLENNITSAVSFETILKLCLYFDCNTCDLFPVEEITEAEASELAAKRAAKGQRQRDYLKKRANTKSTKQEPALTDKHD